MSQIQEEQEIKEVWSSYWSGVEQVAPWDSLSEIVLSSIERECEPSTGAQITEAGCGTGRISHRLALAGADVTCLDITTEALELAQAVFKGTPGKFRLGSILDMPKDQSADLIWNSGVLEHFTIEDQSLAISEFLSILNPGGKVVILTPYSKSPVYRLGKLVLETLGRWPYGIEVPKASLADCLPDGAILEREYTISFLPLLFDAHKFLKPLKAPLCWAWSFLLRHFGRDRVVAWDLSLSRFLGGYLLVSVIVPERNPATSE